MLSTGAWPGATCGHLPPSRRRKRNPAPTPCPLTRPRPITATRPPVPSQRRSTGRVDPVHAAAYKQFGDWIRACYGAPVATGALPAGATSFTLTLPGGTAGTVIDRVRMEEDQSTGQMIYSYTVEVLAAGAADWAPFSSGVSIGAKRIDIAPGGPVAATALRFSITADWGPSPGVVLSAFMPDGCKVPAGDAE